MHKVSNVHYFLHKFPFSPTDDQREAAKMLFSFLYSDDRYPIFLLKGYAGTGKSSLVAGFVSFCTETGIKTQLLAPTGRAAKNLSAYCRQPAMTIHKRIYRQRQAMNDRSAFVRVTNLFKDTLFFVDEASMIGSGGDSIFGSGDLLSDLLEYVYEGQNCRLIMIGDDGQLSPVGESLSCALNPDYYKGRMFDLYLSTLNEVVRQSEDSGIIYNATIVRRLQQREGAFVLPVFSLAPFVDVTTVSGEELIDELDRSYRSCGFHETTLITRSNKRAQMFNQGIRNRILDYEEILNRGDLLMITKNSYFWKESEERQVGEFLANGEMMEIVRVRRQETLYGLEFAHATVAIEGREEEMDVLLNLSVLTSDLPTLSREESNALYTQILDDYIDLTTKSQKYKRLKTDIYYNALQVKYGYSITCHKAQGGQWENVFIDVGNLVRDNLDASFYKWLYTAITRATKRVYFITLPEDMITTDCTFEADCE